MIAAKKSEIPPGKAKILTVKGKIIAIFNADGQFYAIDNTCPHKGGPLGEGDLDGKIVTCPWHGWMFDITSGQGLTAPVNQQTYKVKVDGDNLVLEV